MRTRVSNKFKLFILTSVILNMVLVGIFAGHITRRAGHLHNSQQFEKIIQSLPEDKRAIFRSKLDSMEQENKANRETIKKLRGEAASLLAAENFDATAYQKKLDEMSSLGRNMRKNMYDIIKDIAKNMPKDERKNLADMLQNIQGRR